MRILVALTCICTIVACSREAEPCGKGRLEPDDKVLLVGLDTTLFPLSFARPEGSQGVLVETLREATTRMGFELRITYLGRPALGPSIVAERFDAVGPVVEGTLEQSCESGEWLVTSPALVSKLDSTDQSPVAVQRGTPEHEWAKGLGVKLKLYETYNDVIGALGSVEADRAVIDSADAAHRTANDRGLAIAQTADSSKAWTFAFNESDGELATMLADEIRKMADDGTLAKIRDRWLK